MCVYKHTTAEKELQRPASYTTVAKKKTITYCRRNLTMDLNHDHSEHIKRLNKYKSSQKNGKLTS